MSIIVDPAAERLLAEMSKKTGKQAAELLTDALTAHAQAIGVLPENGGGKVSHGSGGIVPL
jgi:hypothetical protein